MKMQQKTARTGLEHRFIALIAVVLILTVFILTWMNIYKSRSEGLKLLVLQGTTFIETLAQSAENAIASEALFDYLVHKRYHELVIEISISELSEIDQLFLSEIALNHNIYGAYVYGIDSELVSGVSVRGPVVSPPEFVKKEIEQLIASPEENYVLLLDEGDTPDETVHYYIEITNELDRVVLIIADALYYVDALKETQIGFMAQNMSKERGVEYIIYHTTDGIVFSSVKTEHILAIESDPFLTEALESDTIMCRVYMFQDKNLLELVRPFSSMEYPFGLLRVGLNLEDYYAATRGINIHMIAFSGALVALILLVLLYLNSRQKRKEITREFRQIKSLTDKIFDEMRTGVAVVDTRGKTTLVNKAFERILNLNDIIDKQWDEIIDIPELKIDRLNAQAGSLVEQEIIFDQGGDIKTLLVAISKVAFDDDPRSGLVVVVYNITRLKEFEKKAARKERLSEIGNLAAGVAHEIRNPLNTISIAAQRLASEFSPSENEEEYRLFTGQIQEETKRLNVIITRFLALAREEKKKYAPLRLDDLIREHFDFLKLEADRLKIELDLDLESGLSLKADADSLKQVFTNLFNNTREALDGKPGKLVVKAGTKDGVIRITISDNGPGIPKSLREKVPLPYFTTKEAGTGLGLPMVHKTVTDLGGDIQLEESPGGGTMIVISIPNK